eukprot:CAMPEP_0185731494 /NCGR_PEP_ID=MMETSP1171-20130828/13053_1 /TAXON_ID=374046 /ORGANISM="Helicotheca tamensis, Strain CCMP826" /LENGTH=677 /DNA_ID=CAMNT_0028400771 /DNA_START=127 /DNA_END=2160 /DNA_ORIENTATION=+
MTTLFHSSIQVLAFSTTTTSIKSTFDNKPPKIISFSKTRISVPSTSLSASCTDAGEGGDNESSVLNRRDALSKGALVAFSSLFLDASTAKKDKVDAAVLQPVPKANAAVAIPMDTATYPAKAAAVATTAKHVATTGRPPQLETLAALTFGPSAIALAGDATLTGLSTPSPGTRKSQKKVMTTTTTTRRTFRKNFRRNIRAMIRVLNIIALTTPALVRYPFARRNEESYRKWLNFVLKQLERGGAVMIKMAQWASSRPDIFGLTFCDVFKKLQDGTTPHSWSYTESVLEKAYGKDWKDHLKIKKEDILGSGCIAQVYKGTITSPSTGENGNTEEQKQQDVAIKIVHPNVRGGIEDDVSILRTIAKILESLPFGYGEKLQWNNIGGMVEEFSNMLKPQLDLQNEAEHIQRFNENFCNYPDVIFPKLISQYKAHPDVLVETFCSGVPVEKFCETHKDDVEIRKKLCNDAAAVMCEMIFTHNFVHGDLHPGNVFVSPDNKLVLLDCGIVNEYDDADHELMVNIIAAFIRMDGRKAAELMADDSNRRMKAAGESAVQDVEKYINDIERLSKTPRKSDFVFEKVVTYVDYIFNAAARHRVKMNASFVSMMLAVKVQEGVALLLYPAVELMKIANPIILRSEAERIQMSVGQRMQRQVKDKMRDLRVRFDRERNKALKSLEETT